MLISTIVQNVVKSPCLDVTFLETSYLGVFELWLPMIYRTQELCQIVLQILASQWSLSSGTNFTVRDGARVKSREGVDKKMPTRNLLMLCHSNFRSINVKLHSRISRSRTLKKLLLLARPLNPTYLSTPINIP